MKVRELAALLDEQDPEAEVKVSVDHFYVPAQEVSCKRFFNGEAVVIE